MRKTLTYREFTAFGSHGMLQPDAAGLRKNHDFFIRLLDALGEWQERSAQRQRLAALDSRMLSDIGIDRATAAAEAAKPFWRS
jgi:uncharacterized protein YjiS (DUF1127 family)